MVKKFQLAGYFWGQCWNTVENVFIYRNLKELTEFVLCFRSYHCDVSLIWMSSWLKLRFSPIKQLVTLHNHLPCTHSHYTGPWVSALTQGNSSMMHLAVINDTIVLPSLGRSKVCIHTTLPSPSLWDYTGMLLLKWHNSCHYIDTFYFSFQMTPDARHLLSFCKEGPSLEWML